MNDRASFHADAELLREMKQAARRLDRSLSWVLKYAWKIAAPTILAHSAAFERATESRK